MTYYKPKNMTYTDMCIYIDNNIYQDKFDENLIFEYLYHIMVMLARKKYYFKNSPTYDYFGLYSATYLYMRLTDPRQFEENAKITKIKSILNYAKSCLYSLKVSFEQQHYYQINQGSDYEKDEDALNNYEIQNKLTETLNEIEKVEFGIYLNDIANTIKEQLRKIPYKKSEWCNIYLSCLLSLLNRITLDKNSIEYLNQLKKGIQQQRKSIDRMYEKQRYNSVILYNLPDSMGPYIEVLVNEICTTIAQDLSTTVFETIPSNVNIKNLMMSSADQEDE